MEKLEKLEKTKHRVRTEKLVYIACMNVLMKSYICICKIVKGGLLVSMHFARLFY